MHQKVSKTLKYKYFDLTKWTFTSTAVYQDTVDWLLTREQPVMTVYLKVVVQLTVLVLPTSLNDDSRAEDQSYQEDSVPQLLQVLLHRRTQAGAIRLLSPGSFTFHLDYSLSISLQHNTTQKIYSVLKRSRKKAN